MKWERVDKYAMKNGSYTVCKVYCKDKCTYELWDKEMLGRFKSFKEASAFHENIAGKSR